MNRDELRGQITDAIHDVFPLDCVAEVGRLCDVCVRRADAVMAKVWPEIEQTRAKLDHASTVAALEIWEKLSGDALIEWRQRAERAEDWSSQRIDPPKWIAVILGLLTAQKGEGSPGGERP